MYCISQSIDTFKQFYHHHHQLHRVYFISLQTAVQFTITKYAEIALKMDR